MAAPTSAQAPADDSTHVSGYEREEIDLTRLEGPAGACHLSLDPAWDQMTVIRYGQVWDGQLPHEYVVLEEDERFLFLLEDGGERAKALIVYEPFTVEPEEMEAAALWEGPRFTVTALGLAGASAGEVLLAVQGRYVPEEPTMDAAYFHLAIEMKEKDVEASIGYWRAAIEAGDMKAIFGLGYTLYDAGRYREAYDQLRFYTELTPHNAWAWCRFGMACEKLGERRTAIDAYRRAVELERRGGMETDAEERLQNCARGEL